MADKADKSNNNLKRLTIRDVPPSLHYWLKVEAVKRQMTLGEFLIEICAHWQKTHQGNEEE
ncbi:hypothetical protein [Nostoc sp.]|uniref:hypothetical protein n=1 Tax=Nostoc sp. TaxID=1180 RepID=UPI002D78F77D|nr:hypothetical protein [Nostoc sp.]